MDVNDSESLRELIGSLMIGEEALVVSGKPEVIDLSSELDHSSLRKLMGTALIDVRIQNYLQCTLGILFHHAFCPISLKSFTPSHSLLTNLPEMLFSHINCFGIKCNQAALKNSPEVIQTLLDLGAPIDYMDELKHTAVLRASEYGHTEAVKLLCRRGCDTNM